MNPGNHAPNKKASADLTEKYVDYNKRGVTDPTTLGAESSPVRSEHPFEMISQRQSRNRIVSASNKNLTALDVALCEQHLRRFRSDPVVLVWLAMGKTVFGQHKQAEKSLRRAIYLAEGRPRLLGIALMELGALSRERGDFKAAATWYRKALAANPDAEVQIFLGHIAFKRGFLKTAEAHYRRSIAKEKNCPEEAYFNLGGLMVATNRHEEALDCYRKALAIDPKYTAAKLRLRDTALALQLKKHDSPCKTSSRKPPRSLKRCPTSRSSAMPRSS